MCRQGYAGLSIKIFTMSELKRGRLKSIYSADSDLVFSNDLGNPLDPSEVLRKHFYPALKAAELPRIRFHDLSIYRQAF